MSNKYAPRNIQQQQQQQQQHSIKLNNTFCEICGEQYDNNERHLLICTVCGNRTHLNCEQLTNDEYQVLCNPSKHPNIYWKCVNCSWSNSRQIASLENLVELMFNQLKELIIKVDYLCKSQQSISSILHHNQGKFLINQSPNQTNCISPNQHNQFNFNNKYHDIYSNNNQNFSNAGNAPRWSRYLPQAPASNSLPANHHESSTSPFYSSNLENDELINEDIKAFRNLDIEHLPSQANNSSFTKDQLIKNGSKDRSDYTQISSHYQATNKAIDISNSNKLILNAQNKSCEPTFCELNSQQNRPSSPPIATTLQPLYSPTQILNTHLISTQQPLETVSELIYDFVISPPDVPNKEYLLCVLSHIESPSEFYVHVTDESTSNPVDDLSEQLASCYQKSQYPIVLPDNLNELKGKFFAALYASDDNYYRVRVLDVFEDCKFLVQYVDYGNTETVSVDKLNYLRPELFEIPILAVKCSLSHIKPIDKIWTAEHNFFFKSISGYDQEKIVTAYITNRPEIIDYDSTIEVFLWNNDVQLDGLRIDNSKDILINSLMVEIGIANSLFEDNWIEEAEKISKENSDLTPTDAGIKIVATSDANNSSKTPSNLPLTSNTLNPNAITTGNQSFESENSFDTETLDESRTYTDQILSDNMILNDHLNEPASHSNNTNLNLDNKWTGDGKQHKEKIEEFLTKPLTYKQLTSFETQRKPYPLDDLIVGSTVFIKITSTRSPNLFYAVLPFGSTPYEKINVDTAKQLMDKLKTAPEFLKYKDLSNKMKLYYSKAGIKEQFKSSPKSGWLVAAKEDQNFFRARIVQANVDNTIYQLQCIDTGKISSIIRNNLYKLMPQFYELPEFAIQYNMPNIEPYGNCSLVHQRKSAWSEAAKKAFSEFTCNNVFLANILEIVKSGSSSINGSTTKCEKVLCDLLNIFESQENVDDYMINKKYAQYVREEDRLRVELSSSLESDKNSLTKDDNNNEEDDKNKENLDSNIKDQINGSIINNRLESIDSKVNYKLDNNSINENKEECSLNDELIDQKIFDEIKGKNEDENQQEFNLNGKLESDSKQTSIETDYSNDT